jgi:hypothetical protein
MKITRQQLRRLLSEFLDTGSDFSIDLQAGDGDPPASQDPRRNGGGSNKLHQLIQVNFDPERRFDPSSYTKIAIDMSPTAPFSRMREIYNTFSGETKKALYSMYPGWSSPEDAANIWKLRDEFMKLQNNWDKALPQNDNYEYFTIFHPNFGIDDAADHEKLLQLYQSVTGYMPNAELLSEYELIMVSAAAMY